MDQAYYSTGSESKRVSRRALGAVLAVHGGLLFAVATYHKEILLPVEQPIVVSLLADDAPKPDIAPKPLPVKPQPVAKPAQKTLNPQPAVAAPKDPEPQVAARTSERVAESAPETKLAPAAVESASPTTKQEPAAPAEAAPKEVPVEQPKFNADYLDNPAPAYPPLSRKLREEGTVLLRVHVDIGGNPEQVAIHTSSGYPRLDERAADTVRRWKFVPARRGSQPVAGLVIVPIQFSLKG